MTSLDDLVRETLAERAHDVDRVALDAVPAPRRTRRRIAIAAAVLAPALLVGLVVFVPWRDQHDPGPTTPAELTGPPAGMQWVSYHGITLTVPDDFRVTGDPCPIAPGSPGLVSVGADNVSCSRMPIATPDGSPFTVVTLGILGDEPTRGVPVEIAGHPARRADHQGSPPFTGVALQLVDTDVSVSLSGPSSAEIQAIVDSIEYTPVDHLGCVAHLDRTPLPTGPPTGASSGVVCEYDPSGFGGYLIGSRRLTTAELVAVTSAAEPQPTERTGARRALLVYLLTRADGSAQTLAFSADESGPPLPRAYP